MTKKDKRNEVEKTTELIKKINKFFSSKKMTWIITILCGLVIVTLLYMFVSNGNRTSNGLSVSEKQHYTTEQDEQVLTGIQDLINNRLNFLSEIDKLMARDDIEEDEKIKFLKDIKEIMINNSELFNSEMNSLKTISGDAKEDIDRMNRINTISFSYADLVIMYYKNGENEKDLKKIFNANGKMRKEVSEMNYSNYGKGNKLHTKDEIKNNPSNDK